MEHTMLTPAFDMNLKSVQNLKLDSNYFKVMWSEAWSVLDSMSSTLLDQSQTKHCEFPDIRKNYIILFNLCGNHDAPNCLDLCTNPLKSHRLLTGTHWETKGGLCSAVEGRKNRETQWRLKSSRSLKFTTFSSLCLLLFFCSSNLELKKKKESGAFTATVSFEIQSLFCIVKGQIIQEIVLQDIKCDCHVW